MKVERSSSQDQQIASPADMLHGDDSQAHRGMVGAVSTGGCADRTECSNAVGCVNPKLVCGPAHKRRRRNGAGVEGIWEGGESGSTMVEGMGSPRAPAKAGSPSSRGTAPGTASWQGAIEESAAGGGPGVPDAAGGEGGSAMVEVAGSHSSRGTAPGTASWQGAFEESAAGGGPGAPDRLPVGCSFTEHVRWNGKKYKQYYDRNNTRYRSLKGLLAADRLPVGCSFTEHVRRNGKKYKQYYDRNNTRYRSLKGLLGSVRGSKKTTQRRKSNYLLASERSALGVVPVAFQVKESRFLRGIGKTGLGLYTCERLPSRYVIGEYRGKLLTLMQAIAKKSHRAFMFNVTHKRRVVEVIDAAVIKKSSFLRYVNAANDETQQNTEFVQLNRKIWLRSILSIEAGEELLAWYGDRTFDIHDQK